MASNSPEIDSKTYNQPGKKTISGSNLPFQAGLREIKYLG